MSKPDRLVELAGCVLISAVVGARQNPLAPGHPGSWQTKPPITPRLAQGLTPPERTAATATVNQLLEIVRRMPAMAPPAGFQVIPHAYVDIENLDHSDGRRVAYVTGGITVNLAPYEQAGRGAEPNERDTAASIEIRINDLGPLLGSETGLSDDEGAFIRNPPDPVETRHGYPVYEEGSGRRWILIRRYDVPLFAPVTAGRYLRAKLAESERQLAEARGRRATAPAGVPASIIATMDEAIAGLQRRVTSEREALAAMTAVQLATPALPLDTTGDEAPKFAPAGDASATAIVYFNPALMSPGPARTAPQILAVAIGAREDLWPGLAATLDRELDWAALDTIVHRP